MLFSYCCFHKLYDFSNILYSTLSWKIFVCKLTHWAGKTPSGSHTHSTLYPFWSRVKSWKVLFFHDFRKDMYFFQNNTRTADFVSRKWNVALNTTKLTRALDFSIKVSWDIFQSDPFLKHRDTRTGQIDVDTSWEVLGINTIFRLSVHTIVVY